MCQALSKLSIHILDFSNDFNEQARSFLDGDRYEIDEYSFNDQTYNKLTANKEEIDCLVISFSTKTIDCLKFLLDNSILLPCIIFFPDTQQQITQENSNQFLYHPAELYSHIKRENRLVKLVDQALAQFIQLTPNDSIPKGVALFQAPEDLSQNQAFFLLQQRRLADKLRERLGYLGVYYKRQPQFFYRNLSPEEKKSFQQQFMADYREIILDYFNGTPPNNDSIDQFVSQAFLADLSVSYILEIHMSLMDEFAQQLKLEGRSEDILLDYRLTLIDIVAHLCEMYRRSIPREDLPFELLLRMD